MVKYVLMFVKPLSYGEQTDLCGVYNSEEEAKQAIEWMIAETNRQSELYYDWELAKWDDSSIGDFEEIVPEESRFEIWLGSGYGSYSEYERVLRNCFQIVPVVEGKPCQKNISIYEE